MSEAVAPGLKEVRVPLAGLPPLHGRRVPSPAGELALFLLSDGSLKAVLNRCPHKSGSLAEGIVSGDSVFCTQHDWKICLSDGQAQAPDKGCVRTFPVTIEEGFAVIRVAP
jgi:nitrite reductase (NADH) small subunit